jgi:pyruvoyl-dependent arginine decarboxylase (PvlArgDC)
MYNGRVLQCGSVVQCVAVRVRLSAAGRAQCAAVCLAVSGSALSSVWLSGSAAVFGSAGVCGCAALCSSAAVCGSEQ